MRRRQQNRHRQLHQWLSEARCGDSIVGPGEECDDGNRIDTDLGAPFGAKMRAVVTASIGKTSRRVMGGKRSAMMEMTLITTIVYRGCWAAFAAMDIAI